jgi:L-arabinose transport system substrate-binding protein
MRINRRVAMGLVWLAVAALGACGDDDSSSGDGSASTSGSAEKPLLVTINKLGTTGYMIDLARGFKDQASQSGAKSREINVELDSDKTLTEVRNAIASGAKGIAITVPDQKLGPAVIEIANQAGIPLLATNDTIKDKSGKEAPFAGYENRDMGLAVGKDAAKHLNDAGWIDDGKKVGVLSVEVQTLSVCQDRTDAATEVMLEEVSGLKKSDILHVPYDGSAESALKAVPGVVTAHPDIKNWVIYSCSDDGIAGALRALDGAGIALDDIIGVGLGAYQACKEWKSGRPTGFTSALYLNGADVGSMALKALYAAATEDKPLPATEYAPIEMVDPKTYEQAGVKC